MKILLLSNGAPNYHHFFNNLVQLFHADGASVAIAVDSKFSREINELDKLNFDVYEFSSYFAQHRTDEKILLKYANCNLNAALLPDFERADVYGIWGSKDHEYFDRLKSALLTYYETIFIAHSIDTVIYENVSNTFAYFAYFVAEKKGARYIGIGSSRLPGRFSITSDPLSDKDFAKNFNEIRSGARTVAPHVRAWCEEYLENIENIVPDYMKTNGSNSVSLFNRYWKSGTISRIFKVLKHCRDDSYHSFQIGNPFRTYVNLFLRNVYRRFKLNAIKNKYDKPVDGESFLLYPIHFHPESSTSILAGTYLDEYEVIRNIAFNLPQGMKLYVKDHISAWGYPSLDFYKKIQKLPNVRLLHPNEPTKLLIKKSRAVITLTSTVGYEAVLLGKKVFLYGKVFYDFHRDVIPVRNPSQLFELIAEELKKSPIADKNYNIDFLSAYYYSTQSETLNLMLGNNYAKILAHKVFSILKKHRK